MKQQAIITFCALSFSATTLANGGFEPTAKTCVNVGKEITRVNGDINLAKSGIQKSWLQRQLKALKTKRGSCSLKGFHGSSSFPLVITKKPLNQNPGQTF